MEQMTAQPDTELRPRVWRPSARCWRRCSSAEVRRCRRTPAVRRTRLGSASTLELLLSWREQLDIQIDVEEIDQGDLASIGTLARSSRRTR